LHNRVIGKDKHAVSAGDLTHTVIYNSNTYYGDRERKMSRAVLLGAYLSQYQIYVFGNKLARLVFNIIRGI